MADPRIEIVQGDITHFAVDAIVNAANTSLLGGGGVDGAIHRGAGPQLLKECRALGGCPVGEARLTLAYHLPARFVIHTVGPVWHGGDFGEEEQLARCYRSVLALTREHRLRSLALPSISTGAYGFPLEQACRIALREVGDFLQTSSTLERVVFVCFSDQDRQAYQAALDLL